MTHDEIVIVGIAAGWAASVGVLGLLAAWVFLSLFQSSSAAAVNSDCERLRRSIADSSRSPQGTQYQAAAERQRAEIDRTVAYAQQIGCNNRNEIAINAIIVI